MNLFTDKTIFNDISKENPWQNTVVENYYYLSPSAKGSKAEALVKEILKKNNYDVKDRINIGHDCIIDNVKTEIKFGLATNRNYNYETIFNHIGFEKDWEQILFVCVNGDGNIASALYSKNDFPWDLIHKQQGGNNSKNDDYMIHGKDSKNILFNPKARRLF